MDSTKDGCSQLDSIKDLIENIRSDDEQDRIKTIARIPSLILESFETKDEILNQLLLVIYNLNTEDDNFEILNLGNRTVVFKNLLKLYTETIQNHEQDQINALIKLINHATRMPELLVELSYVLHQCCRSEEGSTSIVKETPQSKKNLNKRIDEALGLIAEKASENLYSDALLMILSIMALRQQKQ